MAVLVWQGLQGIYDGGEVGEREGTRWAGVGGDGLGEAEAGVTEEITAGGIGRAAGAERSHGVARARVQLLKPEDRGCGTRLTEPLEKLFSFLMNIFSSLSARAAPS